MEQIKLIIYSSCVVTSIVHLYHLSKLAPSINRIVNSRAGTLPKAINGQILITQKAIKFSCLTWSVIEP